MASRRRLFATVVTVLLAITAIFYQQILRDTFTRAQSGVKVVDSARKITYQGSRSAAGIEHFQNIFYAEEPTGQRRFAAPVPTNPEWGSVIDATRAGAWCPQGTGDILPFTSRVTNISENCLSLRIARPAERERRKYAKLLPVVVWIHGGGHALGSASDILYEPDGLVKLAAAEGLPLVYVGINYRLGLFGFAASGALRKTNDANAGLRDQRAALEWVRDNIESFGGDPSRVTVIGQSVGASDIGLHMTAFGGERDLPFQRAVMMSGGPGLNFNSHPDLVERHTSAIAEQVGCSGRNSDSHTTLECLRSIPFEKLTNLSVTAARAARPPFGEGYFYPTIDDDFIRARPSQSTRAGKFTKRIPLIASWVTNDGAWYAAPSTVTDTEVLESFGRWLPNLSASTKEKLLQLYPVEDFTHMIRPEHSDQISAQYYRAAQLNRDIWFTCPVLDFTWQQYVHNKNGGDAAAAASQAQVRLYEFNATRYTPVFESMGVSMWGVAHLSDIPYLFNNDQLGAGADNSDAQLALGRDFSRAIVKFVHADDNDDGLDLFWPPAFAFSDHDHHHPISSGAAGGVGPGHLSVQVFGGPHGSGPIRCAAAAAAKGTEGDDGRVLAAAEKALDWERLFSRCAFINGAQFREEAGV
ncbi:Alpha/Beta hydrolase protein [Aspergillus carlsbadensis]|nr:Alpha/Beta hydrolase protein [Aspergillus carlsbadensis]